MKKTVSFFVIILFIFVAKAGQKEENYKSFFADLYPSDDAIAEVVPYRYRGEVKQHIMCEAMQEDQFLEDFSFEEDVSFSEKNLATIIHESEAKAYQAEQEVQRLEALEQQRQKQQENRRFMSFTEFLQKQKNNN